jgi:hypothetical protein
MEGMTSLEGKSYTSGTDFERSGRKTSLTSVRSLFVMESH